MSIINQWVFLKTFSTFKEVILIHSNFVIKVLTLSNNTYLFDIENNKLFNTICSY